MPERQPMSEAMYYILLALLHPVHGYGVMQRVRELSGGRLVLGPGTLYGILTRMHTEGYIRLESAEGRRKSTPSPRRGHRRCWRNTGGSRPWYRMETYWRRNSNETAVRTASDGICHRGNRTVLF